MEVYAKLQQGADFEELAVEYSEDPSVTRNQGNLGLFNRGKMVRPFEEAAFAMREPGQISEPVESEYGFHIIKLHEYVPGRQKSFEEVRDGLVQELQTQRKNSVRDAYLAKVTVHRDKALAVIDEHGVAVEVVVARRGDDTRTRRLDGRSGRHADVHALVRRAGLVIKESA